MESDSQSNILIEEIEKFLAEQRKAGLKYEAVTPKEAQEKQYSDTLRSMLLLADNISEKLLDEINPRKIKRSPTKLYSAYSNKKNDEGINFNYYLGGQKDGILEIKYRSILNNPKSRVYISAVIDNGGFFKMDRTQDDSNNQLSTVHYEINTTESYLPENTDVVIRELISAVSRLYLGHRTNYKSKQLPKNNQ